MNDRKLESKIRASYENIAPDILESVLSDCDTQKGQVIVMKEKKRSRPLVRYAAGLAAALMLVIGGLTAGNIYRNNHAIASTVMLDVNPSLEIRVNKKEKVLGVTPLNEDAKTVVGSMDFEGSKLDVTVNALIGSMLRNGYISTAANSILVTVDNHDPAVGQEMQARLMSEIDSVLSSGNVSGAVLGQTVTNDGEIRKLAEQYGITVGKAKLVRQITQQNTLYSFEDLVPLTINELNLISESGPTKLENIESIGKASDASYIGEQAAKEAAYRHAGVKAEDVLKVKWELDWEKGIMVYEVDFDTAEFEFEYEINAKTGEVVKFEKETRDSRTAQPSDPGKTDPSAPAPSYIGEAAAKAAALGHAGVKESDVSDWSSELDHEHGITVYEIEFRANGYEYDYEINALTGTVVKYGKEKDDDARPAPAGKETEPSKPQTPSSYIGEAAAKAAALKHAGVSTVTGYQCELDTENGVAVYEIEFRANGYEYDYEINAKTGAVVKSEKEAD